MFGDPRLPQRFWNKVQQATSGCWEWSANRSASGYGRFATDGGAITRQNASDVKHANPYRADRIAGDA